MFSGFGEPRDVASEHKGKPQRPPASANLLIDSEDRYTSLLQKFGDFQNYKENPANDFIISRNQALLYGYFTRIGVTQIQLNYRVPTIISGVNNQILFANGSFTEFYPVSLNEGYYNATTLAAEIQTRVLALAGTPIAGFTCVYSELDGGLLMEADNDFVIDVTNGAETAAQRQVWSHTAYTIGAINATNEPNTTQILSTPNLIYTKYVDIVSNNLTKFQRVKDADTNLLNKTNVIARVYLTAPNTRTDPNATGGPFNLCWDPNTPKMSMWSPNETVNELDFRLYDEFGELLYWDTRYNTEFQMTLLASET